MTESEAQQWLADHGWWDNEMGEKLRHFVTLVLEEADRQNLISAASRDSIWARHIVDSAQLLTMLSGKPLDSSRPWIDLGAGAGFPGIVVACLHEGPMQLVEMRGLRVAFLERCVQELGLDHVEVLGTKVEKVENMSPASVISARAYAPLERLLASAEHLADGKTIWLLPKGRNAEKELDNVRADWQALFHVEQSITDPESAIVTIRNLRRTAKRHAKYAPQPKWASRRKKPSL